MAKYRDGESFILRRGCKSSNAVRWMTLPLGRDRDETLNTIHMNWPKDDPTGKEAFVKEHGIK